MKMRLIIAIFFLMIPFLFSCSESQEERQYVIGFLIMRCKQEDSFVDLLWVEKAIINILNASNILIASSEKCRC